MCCLSSVVCTPPSECKMIFGGIRINFQKNLRSLLTCSGWNCVPLKIPEPHPEPHSVTVSGCRVFADVSSYGCWDETVGRVCAPWFFVWSQQRFGVTDIKVPSARHSSRSWTNRVIALRQISVTALFYLEDSRGIRPRRREESGGARPRAG